MSVGAFVIGFLPAILIAYFVFAGAGWAVFLAMYFPHFVMMVGFLFRLCWVSWAMANGKSGPWEAHVRKDGGEHTGDDGGD